MKVKIGVTFFIAVALWTGCAPKEHLVILHTADTLSQFFIHDADGLGGAARLKTYIESIRGKNQNVLIFDSGGILPGSVYASIFKGKVNIELMNAMGYTALGLGHHEFDYGLDNLFMLEDIANFPFLSVNVVEKNKTRTEFKPYAITNIAGAKIVIIGMTSPDQNLFNRTVAEQVDLIPPEQVLSEILRDKKLAATNDIIILLSYLGFERNVVLAQAFPEISIILSGYGDTTTVMPYVTPTTYIVQPGKNGSYVGKIDLTISEGKINSFKYNLVAMDKNIPDSKWVLTYLNDKTEIVDLKMMEKICDSMMTLDATAIRSFPGTIGNLVADILAYASQADIAVINSGSIRSSIPMGTVHIGDIYQLFPYENCLVKGKISGSVLKQIIKKGIDKRGSGGFLYYSKGLKVTVGTNKEIGILWNGAPIQDGKDYTVATADFLWMGGDGYIEFLKSEQVTNSGMLIRDIILSYLQNVKIITEQIADPVPRILFLSGKTIINK
jgi:5'-nucleotidase